MVTRFRLLGYRAVVLACQCHRGGRVDRGWAVSDYPTQLREITYDDVEWNHDRPDDYEAGDVRVTCYLKGIYMIVGYSGVSDFYDYDELLANTEIYRQYQVEAFDDLKERIGDCLRVIEMLRP